jgi:hypothetical protein
MSEPERQTRDGQSRMSRYLGNALHNFDIGDVFHRTVWMKKRVSHFHANRPLLSKDKNVQPYLDLTDLACSAALLGLPVPYGAAEVGW